MKNLLLRLYFFIAALSFISCNRNHSQNVEDSQQIVKFPFQRKIWTYWNSENNQIPLPVKVCLDNLQSVAKKHNFTFVCLNQSNVRNYITNYDHQFVEVRKNSIQKDFAHAADLLRVIIIEQQGGIWVDSTTVFLNGLTELQNIMSENYAHMITNRFSPEPDMLLFFYSFGQSRIQRVISDPRNSSSTILYNEHPNNQIWFIASKKQSPLIKQIKKTYTKWTTLSFNEVEKKLRDEDIYMNRIDDFSNYLYLNMVVSYILQKKQSELDKSLTFLGERKTSFEEYKLWSLHSEYGPMIMIREDLLPLDMLFLYSKQEFKAMGWDFKFFIKQFGYFRYYIGWYLDNLIETFKDYNGTFQQWMETNPDPEYCEKITLIVKDSIFHQMLEKSTVLHAKGIRVFSKQQLEQWNAYCSKESFFFTKVKKFFKGSIFHSIILRLFMFDKVPKGKVYEIMSKGQQLSFIDWIKIKYADNEFLLFDFGYFFVNALLMFWIYQKLVNKITKMLKIHRDEHDLHLVTNEQNKIFVSQQIFQERIRKQKENIESQILKKKQKLLSFLIFVLFLSNLAMYNAVDLTGGRQQPQTIFFFVLFTFLLEFYIEKEIQSQYNENRKAIDLKYQYEFFYLFVNYITAYLTMVFIRRNRFWLNWCSLVIGCVGPCVIKVAKVVINQGSKSNNQLENNKNSQSWLVLGVNKIRIIVIITLAFITFIPNLKYISIESGYILKYLPIIPLMYLASLYLYVLIKTLTQKHWLEFTRLIFLVIVVAQLCWSQNKPQHITHLTQRMIYIFRTVLILQTIYLQAGTSVTIRNFYECQFMKSFVNQILVFIGPVLIEFLLGRFYWNFDYIMYNYSDYTEHLLIYSFSTFIVALLSSLQKIDHYQSIESIEINEIEPIYMNQKKLKSNTQ